MLPWADRYSTSEGKGTWILKRKMGLFPEKNSTKVVHPQVKRAEVLGKGCEGAKGEGDEGESWIQQRGPKFERAQVLQRCAR